MARDTPAQNRLSAAAIEATIDVWQASDQERWWPTAGDSMAPLIANGDEVLLKFSADGLRRGDIVVFRHETLRRDGLIAHRVIRIRQHDHGCIVLTKGDNCALADTPVTTQDVLGRVVAIRRAGECIRIDTPALRRRARLIATLSLAEFGGLRLARRLGRWLPLPRPLPGGGIGLRLGQAMSRAAARLLMK